MNRITFIGLVGVVAIVLAVALTFWRDASDEKSLKEAEQAPAVSPELAGKATSAVPAPKSPEKQVPKPADKPKNILPSFDVVRVNPEGDAVIAGRAAPGAIVTVMDGDSVVGVVTADQNGEWVLVPDKPLKSGNRALSVTAKLGDGEALKSADVVVLAVPERPVANERPLAVLVPRDGMETKKVLQKPRAAVAGRNIALTLDVVDYDEAGKLKLSGQANPGNETRVYLNNKSIGGAVVSTEGGWELRPEETVEPGLYTLRVDEIGKAKVVARIELPFSRAAPVTALNNEDYVIVQPGNSLWRISRRVLGEGTMYSVIYEANKEQIRSADLIYPGQVFAIPKQK